MPTAGWVALSPQEMRLLKLFTEGHQNKAAAVDTVSLHLRSIYEKLHVHSKSEAVIKAINKNIV